MYICMVTQECDQNWDSQRCTPCEKSDDMPGEELTEKDRNQGFKANGQRRCEAATTDNGTMTSIELTRYPDGKAGKVVAIIAP